MKDLAPGSYVLKVAARRGWASTPPVARELQFTVDARPAAAPSR